MKRIRFGNFSHKPMRISLPAERIFRLEQKDGCCCDAKRAGLPRARRTSPQRAGGGVVGRPPPPPAAAVPGQGVRDEGGGGGGGGGVRWRAGLRRRGRACRTRLPRRWVLCLGAPPMRRGGQEPSATVPSLPFIPVSIFRLYRSPSPCKRSPYRVPERTIDSCNGMTPFASLSLLRAFVFINFLEKQCIFLPYESSAVRLSDRFYSGQSRMIGFRKLLKSS